MPVTDPFLRAPFLWRQHLVSISGGKKKHGLGCDAHSMLEGRRARTTSRAQPTAARVCCRCFAMTDCVYLGTRRPKGFRPSPSAFSCRRYPRFGKAFSLQRCLLLRVDESTAVVQVQQLQRPSLIRYRTASNKLLPRMYGVQAWHTQHTHTRARVFMSVGSLWRGPVPMWSE